MRNRLRFFVLAVVVGVTLAARADWSPPTGFKSLWNGADLSGWNGRTDVWKVEGGMIVGQANGLKQNEFLATDKSYRDFVLRAKLRLVNGYGNSGIQFRSIRLPNSSEMFGYQADVGEGWWGCLYDESRRNKVLAGPKVDAASKRRLDAALKPTDWNDYMIRAMDDRIELWVNGQPTVNYTEQDPKVARDGLFGLQLHADSKPSRVEFKDLYLQELPIAEPTAPGKTGFLFEETSLSGSPFRYAVYLPKNFHQEPGKKWPAILFLHGSGERGTDGSLPIKVGLGPAVLARPDFPFVVVFVQAEKSWNGPSPDAHRALVLFDQACQKYNVDPDQRHVTGISMGGHGAWEAALARPHDWATATIVCGFGDTGEADKIAHLPIQLFCGDKDGEMIVNGMHGIAAALKTKNPDVKATWYPGVGHNSWDDAYNTDSLYQWMLAHKRSAK